MTCFKKSATLGWMTECVSLGFQIRVVFCTQAYVVCRVIHMMTHLIPQPSLISDRFCLLHTQWHVDNPQPSPITDRCCLLYTWRYVKNPWPSLISDRSCLLCCTRDDTLKILDLRMNQVSTTLRLVYFDDEWLSQRYCRYYNLDVCYCSFYVNSLLYIWVHDISVIYVSPNMVLEL